MSPKPPRSGRMSAGRSPPKSAAASKLATRMHALRTQALRKINAGLEVANASAQSLAEELLAIAVTSDDEMGLITKNTKETTSDFQEELTVDYDGVKTLTLNSMAPLPFHKRSPTPPSRAVEQVAPKPVCEPATLSSTFTRPAPSITPLDSNKSVPEKKVSKSTCQSPQILAVEEKPTVNSKPSQSKTDAKARSIIASKPPKNSSKPTRKMKSSKLIEGNILKLKEFKPVKPATVGTRNLTNVNSIPRRIYSEIAVGSSTSKVTTSQATTPQIVKSQVNASKDATEQTADNAVKIFSESLTFLAPMNDDCTVENSMYPFKLVLSPLEERPLEKVEIWIATCPPNSIAMVFKFIHTYLIPLDIAAGVDLKHLRRLRKIRENTTGTLVLEVILCGGESISRQELAALLWSHSEEIPQLRPRLHLASKWAAYTLQQYETFSRLWPVTMRTEAKRRLARVPLETTEMQRFMAAVIRLSQRVYLLKDKPPYDLPIATLIVDPATSRVLASTYDTRISTKHPLNHSVVTAINLLAMSPHQRTSRDTYYASGYDFYTTHEPCVMCCMAMVHSRARRCVFWREMRYTGGKGLGWKKELNHKYMCFQWVGDETVGTNVVEDVPWDICA